MNIKSLEKIIFSKKTRFEINRSQLLELNKNFNHSIILVIGAAGSIGKSFTMYLKKFNFKKLILIDNNETGLADLNRDINLTFKKNLIKRTDYICEDINNVNLHNIIKNNKISHYLNFAALKHVRSEENFISTKNMFRTNSFKPFNIKKINTLNTLKQIFFISTDKAANPSSIMGCTKKIMENNLCILKKKNKRLKISTVRFANVSFSNGSLLQNIFNRINNKELFGIPLNVKRFFITHKEATNLCFKALLKESDNHIVIPTYKSLGNSIELKEITKKIVLLMKKKPVFSFKIKPVKKNQQLIIVNSNPIMGQKNDEILHEPSEKLLKYKKDADLRKIKFYENEKIKFLENKIKKTKSLKEIKKICSIIFTNYIEKIKTKTILLKNNI